MKTNTLSSLEKEVERIMADIAQGILFDEIRRDKERQVQDKELELELNLSCAALTISNSRSDSRPSETAP